MTEAEKRLLRQWKHKQELGANVVEWLTKTAEFQGIDVGDLIYHAALYMAKIYKPAPKKPTVNDYAAGRRQWIANPAGNIKR